MYSFETFSDYLASLPPKKEDPDWLDYNFPSAPDGTEAVTESMKRLRNAEEAGDGVQKEAADSSKVRFTSDNLKYISLSNLNLSADEEG